jgi:hypothetical protein
MPQLQCLLLSSQMCTWLALALARTQFPAAINTTCCRRCLASTSAFMTQETLSESEVNYARVKRGIILISLPWWSPPTRRRRATGSPRAN